MTEREVNFPRPLATRVDERVYALVRAEAERTGVSESAVIRRVLDSWAIFGVHASSNSRYVEDFAIEAELAQIRASKPVHGVQR